MALKTRKPKATQSAPESPIEWERAAPAELAKFDPSTKICDMNCGKHGLDPRGREERLFLCDLCYIPPSMKGTAAMPMIDIDDLKHGLLPVQHAETRYKQASANRKAGYETGADMGRLFEAEEQAHKTYRDACIVLYGYVRGAVNVAEGRRADQDE